ncbi:MAG TPA: Gfo/Idh/MocA family oxidoreductase [Myxococcota bacterium]|jgi:predicted dehydrogenase
MPVRAILIGAGLRGRDTYSRYAAKHPERLRIVAVAEPNAQRREQVAARHALGAAAVHASWQTLLAAAPSADAVIVATSDALHVEPTLAVLAAGHHVLLEKPIALDAASCVRVVNAARSAGRVLQICHPMRFIPFYQKLAELVAGGAIGRLVHLDLREHIAAWHMVHSYVRGKFRSTREAAPILLAKSCHDLDLLHWLVGERPARVSSSGALSHYCASGAPAVVPERCTDGCAIQAECPHDAVRFYADPDERLARHWPWSDVSLDPAREARLAALRTGRYGRCIYRCDNDVLDHQHVSVEFASGVTASFGLHGFANEERRTVRISGTRGEIRGVLHEGAIEVSRVGSLGLEKHRTEGSPLDHFGGDDGLLDHFSEVMGSGDLARLREAGASALEGHLLGFAAERARATASVVDCAAFWREVGAV